ncbi:MAG: DEAD/DEAH box helicase [Desulfobia sp.]
MIPSVLSRQIEQGIKDFLSTTFHVTTPFFHGMLDKFLHEPGALFKGPYVSINLPYRPGDEATRDFFPEIPLAFTSYRHQEEAFKRLSAPNPEPTIIATGTGSGKTECFTYPILDHCLQQSGRPGIKAVLIYPMNALAFDQASRIARIIWNTPGLKGKVSAGMYIGQGEKSPQPVMGPDYVITDKDILRGNPPDILMTNYKMLDYLMIRPRDIKLWARNGPETLRYIVVDELHTFDGAQGTDLACLLRRLKAKLKAPEHFICPVGTSATLGGKESMARLCDYAGRIFSEAFPLEAVITESQKSAGEFIGDQDAELSQIPGAEHIEFLKSENYPDYPSYVRSQAGLWTGLQLSETEWPDYSWRLMLGEKLKNHIFFQNLLKILNGRVRPYDSVISELVGTARELKNGDEIYQTLLLNSMLALISEAGFQDSRKLQVRVQHWCRELKRMVVSVEPDPCLRFADDLTDELIRKHLPVVHCRECGLMGWVGKSSLHGGSIDTDLQSIYVEFFKKKKDKRLYLLFPVHPSDHRDTGIGRRKRLCTSCIHLNQEQGGNCSSCGSGQLIPVEIPVSASHNCPTCNAVNSLTLLGSQAASLTSVMIGQLFASNFNDDKKLLTFSDNVQDAAHRAAFFGARTYRFTFRTALQQFVKKYGEGLNLAELADQLVDHWRQKLDPEQFVSLFIAPNMTGHRDFENLTTQGKLTHNSILPDRIARRLRWEIYSEYGFSARIGRTLEKSGGSVLAVNNEKLESTAKLICEILNNELEELRQLKPTDTAAMILGLITNIRQQGGIFHPDLEDYIEDWGKTYKISQSWKRWMPSFGKITRAPAFVTTRANIERFPQLLSRRQGSFTWYEWWASRFFPQMFFHQSDLLEKLYEIVFKQLEQAGIVEHRWRNQHYIWGLTPRSLRVRSDVIQYRCDRCGYIVSGSADDSAIWTNMPCLRRNCRGSYRKWHQGLDYYGHLYSKGDISRLYTKEHSGLLERDERQRLEENFKAPPDERKPWYPNLLSSTPTLEMGIDIGDLSTTIQCSVPPGQANYLQRIGRSGRKDGNGLNLTVANGKAHDLYFYNDPLEMIAGEIQPPGVFLDASAVLERQFTAYCFDCWVSQGLADGTIPPRLGTVLNFLARNNPDQFPFNLIRFITNRQTELFDGFVELFKQDISSQSLKHLEHFVYGSAGQEAGMTYRITQRLNELFKERKSLKAKVDQLYREINKLKANPARDQNYQEEISQLKRERSGLQALIKTMNASDIFNFFTTEGLLPNYAFPESGIMLNSIIYRKVSPNTEDEKRYESKSFTYERPSSAGIRELAPNNAFYADGRRVVIDKVDMRLSKVEDWRMCDSCPHMEHEALAKEHQLCPRCGSSLWSDQGRKQELLRIRQVFANTPDWKSRIADERDERDPVFFTTNMLVDSDDQAVIDAYQINDPECPFGFEFLSRATLREINFGPCGKTSNRIRIAGQDMERPGFILCKHCGKVQGNSGELEHDFGCPARNKDKEENFIDCVYLYREFSSEAIKILLPVTGYEGSERRLNSFVAALHLGLKHYFGGSAYAIEHLQTTVSSEPVPDSSLSKQYLVIYDTVPGGTGFLKQLMRSETLIKVLEKALSVLQYCKCRLNPEKDGCYACLFAYRNSFTMRTTSRDTAVDMLSLILSHKEQLLQVNSLKDLSVSGLLDSELEALFLEALRRLRKKGFSLSLKKSIVNGKPGYFLELNEQVYEIEPQVELTPSDGIAIPSRADFVFWPARSTMKVRPVAVFTDGYIFHRDRIGLDLAQRMAIIQSGKFNIWSITWRDVNAHLNQHSQRTADLLHPENSKTGSQRFFKLLDKYGLSEYRKWHTLDNFLLFSKFLSDPDIESWRRYAFVQAVSFLDITNSGKKDSYQRWEEELIGLFPDPFLQDFRNDDAEGLIGLMSADLIRVFFRARKEALQHSDTSGIQIFGYLNDDSAAVEKESFENQWVNYLRLYNLFQFLSSSVFISQEGANNGYYFELQSSPDELSAKIQSGPGERSPDSEGEMQQWDELFALTDEEIHPLLLKFQKENSRIPEAGFELAVNGKVVAEAELGWPDLQVAYLTEDQMQRAGIFREAGWEVSPLSSFL